MATRKNGTRTEIPRSAFERVAQAMKDGCDLLDQVVRDEKLIAKLKRHDIARDLILCADLLRLARLLMQDTLKKAAEAQEEWEET